MIDKQFIKQVKDHTYCIAVPKGIRYLSQWSDFELFDYPHILDKQIPGCGFTEFCLTNNQDLVLASPRKLLLENKYDQHKGDVYYVINSYEEVLGVDKNINKISKSQVDTADPEKDIEEIKQKKLEFYNALKKDIEDYIDSRRMKRLPFKIIVTYDSFYLVKGILKEISIDCVREKIQIVVDEMQSIFTDSTFKSSTENNFITSLLDLRRVCFVSATPMIEKYLRLIELFEKMDYYELDWASLDHSRIKKPELKIRYSNSVITTAKSIIQSYLDSNFEYKYARNTEGRVVKIISNQAVIYLNSVNSILSIVKGLKLKPEQVNILCADTLENQKRIKKKLGRKYSIGSIPLKGEPHKMFTFCTRTVYLGADFYSTCARSFILSDANIETLAVDISLDLPQILGRQRLKENPWKDEADFYYKPICKNKKLERSRFDARVLKKMDDTNNLLSIFEKGTDKEKLTLAIKYERDAINSNYRTDYVAVNNILISPGVYIKKPILNKLVKISEERAYEIQQKDYKDRFNVFSEVEGNYIESKYQQEVLDFLKSFEELKNLSSKLKYFCEYNFSSKEAQEVVYNQINEKHFHEYLDTLSRDELKACGYNITYINRRLGIITFDKSSLIQKVMEEFIVGNKYTLQYIKDKLTIMYSEVGYDSSPKALDLEDYYEVKKVKMKDDTGKWVHGLELIGKKQ